jgi:hypothetical protein
MKVLKRIHNHNSQKKKTKKKKKAEPIANIYITTVFNFFKNIKQLAIKITSSLAILSLKPPLLEGFSKN